MLDFTPTKEQISLHGLGFIQIKLNETGTTRIHIWYPGLPRRKCYHASAIHNHRFGFRSTVLVGEQINQRFVTLGKGSGVLLELSEWYHGGKRMEVGGRETKQRGLIYGSLSEPEIYKLGDTYSMAPFEYHQTIGDGPTATLMVKDDIRESGHASTLIQPGVEFDAQFDRFQFAPERLWEISKSVLGMIGG